MRRVGSPSTLARVVLACACSSALGCEQKFEGEISMDETSESGVRHVVTEARGDQLRAPDQGSTGYSIFDSHGRIYDVDPVKKEILVIDLKAKQERGDHFEKTQATETIVGHTCVVWRVTLSDGQHGEVCLASDVRVGGPRSMWFPLLEEKGLPLRGILHDKDGKLRLDMRVTAIDAKKLDATRFQLPSDYKKVSLFK